MRRTVRAALLAFDLGSTSAKALLLDAQSGAPIAIARRATSADGDGLEQDADQWWVAICSATREVMSLATAKSSVSVEVHGIGVAGHGPSLTPVRADGRAAGPALMWRDRRSANDEAALQGILGRGGWLLGELPKARWLIRERPEIAAAATWLLSSWDALTLRLSGEAVSAFWDPARSVSPAQRGALLAAGLDERALPPEVFPGTRIGALLPGPAADLGLPAGIPIAAGMNDGLAAVVGAGLTEPGLGVDVGGTAGGVAVSASRAEALRISAALPGRLWSGPAPAPFGDVVILGGAFAGTGRLLEWVVSDLLEKQLAAAPARRAELFLAAAALPLGADGLIAKPIPHSGWSNPRSVDEAFLGRTERHTAAHFVRAAIEAGALAVAHLLEPAINAGLHIGEMRLSGPATGAAPGPLSGGEPVPAPLIQLRADLFGRRVVIGQNPESSAAGAAALAGIASGMFSNLREAAHAIATPDRRVEPDERAQDRRRELLQRYEELLAHAGESGAGRRED